MDNNAEKYVGQAREMQVWNDRLAALLDDSKGADTDYAKHRQTILAASRSLRMVRISAQALAIKHLAEDNRQLAMNL